MSALLAGLVWFNFFNAASARELGHSAADLFDDRPARSVLFIGNSRTYPYDMPYMVREIADSAGAPETYQVRMHAPNGQTLADHWNNPRVRSLIEDHWDDVDSALFLDFGEKLVDAAAANGSRPTLFVGWNYGRSHYQGRPAAAEGIYYDRIQRDYQRLAARTGARRANVGQVWRRIQATNPSFSLDADGNHPNLEGSYANALVFYAHLSGGSLERVTYGPPGLDPARAAMIRQLVARALEPRSV